MRLAASDTADTGATTLLMKIMLDSTISPTTASITPHTTSTVSITCWSMSRTAVT